MRSASSLMYFLLLGYFYSCSGLNSTLDPNLDSTSETVWICPSGSIGPLRLRDYNSISPSVAAPTDGFSSSDFFHVSDSLVQENFYGMPNQNANFSEITFESLLSDKKPVVNKVT